MTTIATLFSFDGNVHEAAQHQCTSQLEKLRSNCKGLYASVGAVGDSGQQQILVIGSADDADAVEKLLSDYGLECVAKRNSPEFLDIKGEPDEFAICARLRGEFPGDLAESADYPYFPSDADDRHFNPFGKARQRNLENDIFVLTENPEAGLLRALAARS
jgi:hypothetical protein